MSCPPDISFAALSHVGRVRKNNEDSYGAFPEGRVWCVADGMGGGECGEVASAAVVEAVTEYASSGECLREGLEEKVLGVSKAVSVASRRICDFAKAKGFTGCGSTFVGLVLDTANPLNACALHAGDSRLYRVRDGIIRRVTRDHSLAAQMGTREENLHPMFRNMVLRAVGMEQAVQLERTPFDLKFGDRVLLCSDGLTHMVPDRQILAVMNACDEAKAAAKALVEAANANGGADNVTVIVVDIGPRRAGGISAWGVLAWCAAVLLALAGAWGLFRLRASPSGPPKVADAQLRANPLQDENRRAEATVFSESKRIADESAKMKAEAEAAIRKAQRKEPDQRETSR